VRDGGGRGGGSQDQGRDDGEEGEEAHRGSRRTPAARHSRVPCATWLHTPSTSR
jgi:hypothetical protein